MCVTREGLGAWVGVSARRDWPKSRRATFRRNFCRGKSLQTFASQRTIIENKARLLSKAKVLPQRFAPGGGVHEESFAEVFKRKLFSQIFEDELSLNFLLVA